MCSEATLTARSAQNCLVLQHTQSQGVRVRNPVNAREEAALDAWASSEKDPQLFPAFGPKPLRNFAPTREAEIANSRVGDPRDRHRLI